MYPSRYGMANERLGTTAAGFDFPHPWRQATYWFVALFSLAAMVLGCLPGAAHAFMSRRPGA